MCRSVQPAATVQAFDALCEVQSDKASVEITSPFDGVIRELLVKEGEVAKVGSGLCVIEVDEEEGVVAEEESPRPPPHPEQQAASSSESALPSQADKAQTSSTSSARKSKPHPLDPNVEKTESQYAPALGHHENVLAAPSVRHYARHQGVDLSKLIPGSGKGGRIVRKDVEDHLAGVSAAPQASTSSSSVVTPADAGQDVVVELGRTRYGMWKAMTKVRFDHHIEAQKLTSPLLRVSRSLISGTLPAWT